MAMRFRRLTTMRSALILGAAVLSVNVTVPSAVNLAMGDELEARRIELERQYQLDSDSWHAYAGEVWRMADGISTQTRMYLTASVFLWVSIAIMIAPTASEREAVKAIARRKLSQSVLSETEMTIWAAVLKEAEGSHVE